MRNRISPTILERAIIVVPGFKKVLVKLSQQVTLRRQSESTLSNYGRRIALFVLHFKRLPEQVSEDEINEYLVSLARDPKSPSRSSFKHMVYGLRYYYRLLGMNKNAIALPCLKRETKLPIILNRKELRELFLAPSLLKQRIVLTLIYSAGLRGQEVINLKISDVDFERMTIHIRQSKYKKDRILPLSPTMSYGLKKYLKAENPHIWLFNGKQLDSQYSVRGLSWVMRENLKKTSITKEVNLHSLRHTYATHLLEEGVEFLKRFCLYVLPKRFVRIRRYSIYNHTTKRNLELQFEAEHKPDIDELIESKKKETPTERIKRLTGFDIGLCQKCKKGRMHGCSSTLDSSLGLADRS